MKKRFAGLGLILVLLISTMSFAFAYEDEEWYYDEYTTDRYDVDVVVDEDHVFHVTETIDVDFYVEKHGIFRYIPTNPRTYGIENLKALGDPYEVERDGELILKIGDPNELIEGDHTYTITYDMVCYEDNSQKNDYFSLDLLPTEWETPIKETNIEVTLPKAVDEKNWNIYSGFYGAEGNELDIQPQFLNKGKTLRFEASNLGQGEGITLAAELPEGYWVNPAAMSSYALPIAVILVLMPLLMMLLWFFFGRDPKLVKTVEFRPPEGMTPAEIGYFADNMVEQDELSYMLVYFAEKGYLEIHEYEKGKYELIKLMEIPETEKHFAKTLFDGYFSKEDRVKMDELPEELADTYAAVEEQLVEQFKEDKSLYSGGSRTCRILGSIIYLCVTVLAGLIVMIETSDLGLMIPLLILGIPACIGFTSLYVVYDGWYTMDHGGRIGTIVLAAFMLIVNAGVNGFLLWYFCQSILLVMLMVVSFAITLVFMTLMNARTQKSMALLGRILGFRDFIETAELEKLKLMVDENPTYFYNIMPYAAVFGLSEKWISNFEKLPPDPPGWYHGYGTLDTWDLYFITRMNQNFCNSVNEVVNASEDTGGGGFGGGGFSGGGFGGGGGGSW